MTNLSLYFFSLCEYSGRDCGSWRVEKAQAMSKIEECERVGGRRRRTHDEVIIFFAVLVVNSF